MYELYTLDEAESIPGVGDISIILDKNGRAVCVIKNIKVYKTRFCDVSEEHAYKEGEGRQA